MELLLLCLVPFAVPLLLLLYCRIYGAILDRQATYHGQELGRITRAQTQNYGCMMAMAQLFALAWLALGFLVSLAVWSTLAH